MDYGGKVELQEIGKVLAIGDGIARCVVVGASNASRIMRRARRRGALPGPSAAGSEPWAWGGRRGLGGMLVAPLLVAPARMRSRLGSSRRGTHPSVHPSVHAASAPRATPLTRGPGCDALWQCARAAEGAGRRDG